MPELPEVETVRAGLNKLIVGKTITHVEYDWPKSFPNSPNDVAAFLIGAKISAVRRRAKVLIIDLSTSYSLVVHLKMTGQLVYVDNERWGAGHPNDSLVGNLPDKSTRVTITFKTQKTTDNPAHLYFNDQRKFGWMRLIPTAEIPNIDFMLTVGPEPLESSFTYSIFEKQMYRRKNSGMKAVLLDQKIIAGIGNIYADESLFMASIHPESIVASVPKYRLKLLHQSIIDVLSLSIEKGGSTDRNYVNAEGKKGSYIEFAKVFRKQNQPCPNNCGKNIVKIRVVGRGTHICERCQKMYKVSK